MVVPAQIPPEEVLYAWVKVSVECYYSQQQECISCVLTVDFKGQDLTGGDYPVTNVVLTANGVVWHNSGAIFTVLYQKSVEGMQVGCGETFNIKVVVTNNIGLQATATKTVVTSPPLL
jgi:hypothetical protein